MKSSDLRNVVLLGHGGVGKTSAAEAMLYNAGAADRLGRINEGNTILDYDQEEIRRQASAVAYSFFEVICNEEVFDGMPCSGNACGKCARIFRVQREHARRLYRSGLSAL